MPGRDPMAAGMEILGQLSILADGSPLRLEFRGHVIELIFPNLRTSLKIWRSLRRVERRQALRFLHGAVQTSGLEVAVRVNRHLVGRLAAGSRGGWLASWLGLGPMELKPRALLAALVQRDPVAPGTMPDEDASTGGPVK